MGRSSFSHRKKDRRYHLVQVVLEREICGKPGFVLCLQAMEANGSLWKTEELFTQKPTARETNTKEQEKGQTWSDSVENRPSLAGVDIACDVADRVGELFA